MARSNDSNSVFAEAELIPEKDAAAEIKLNAATLITYRKRGIGPPYTVIGRKIYYTRSNLIDWLARGGTRANG